MIIIWSVQDGFACGKRERSIEIPDEELKGFSQEEQDEIIEECVLQAFNENIDYSWRRG